MVNKKKVTKKPAKPAAKSSKKPASASAVKFAATLGAASGVPCPGAGTTSNVPVGALCQQSVADCLDEVLRQQGNGWALCGYRLNAGANSVDLLFK